MSLLVIAVGIVAALFAWRSASASLDSAHELSLAVTLAAVAGAINIVVPIPNVEVTTTFVVICALAIGPGFAATVGVLAVVVTDLGAGVGVWTAWQAIAISGIALLVASTPGRRQLVDPLAIAAVPVRAMLCAIVVVCVFAFDIVVTITGIWASGMSGGVPLARTLELGVGYSLLHAAGSAIATLVAGPALVRCLARARSKLHVIARSAP